MNGLFVLTVEAGAFGLAAVIALAIGLSHLL